MGALSTSRAYVAPLLRLLIPVAATVIGILWLADAFDGVAGVVAAVLVAAAILGAWFATGFRGDPGRSGTPLVAIPAAARLVLEAVVALGAALVLAVALDAPIPGIVLAVLGLAHLALRSRDAASSRAGEIPPEPVAAAATEDRAVLEPVADYSRRAPDGSFEFGRTITVDAGLDDVWRFVWDFEEVALCIPGCERVEEHEPHRSYTAHVRKKLGPFLIRMPLEITITDHEERRSINASVVGRDQRLRSEVEQRLAVTLGEGPDGTLLRAVIHASIRGVLASVDATLIERNLDQTIGEFTQALNARLPTRTSSGTPS